MADTTTKKRRYHHGDLRAALLDAAETLIAREGALDFTLADASRMAGVSTAAPYRHFVDKENLLDAVRARGFERLTQAMRAEIAALDRPGTVDDIIAIGLAYVRFAIREPNIFRLMFGSRHQPRPDALSRQVGEACFGTLLERVTLWRERSGVAAPDTRTVALPLWSLVHGIATLQIDRDFDAVAPGTRTDPIVDFATRHYLAGLDAGGAAPSGQSSA